MISSDHIVFDCPKCRQGIKTPKTTAGQTAECPYCRAAIRVPDDNNKIPRAEAVPPKVPPVLPSQPVSPDHSVSVEQRTCGMAVAGMVLGIVSIVSGRILVGPLLAIIGLVLSSVAMRKISREPDEWNGYGMAVAGLTTSIIGLIVGLAFLLFLGTLLGVMAVLSEKLLNTMPAPH